MCYTPPAHALLLAVQDKHTDMVAALEAALSAQSSKYAAVSQQLRLELKETLAKATQVRHPLQLM